MAAKIAIFDDLELLQELRRRRVPERVILAEIMYGLERNRFALVPSGNSNLTNDQTLNLPEDWFPLMSSSRDLRFKERSLTLSKRFDQFWMDGEIKGCMHF